MDGFTSMSMPYLFMAGLIAIVVLVVALYVIGRVMGGRVQEHEHQDEPVEPNPQPHTGPRSS